MKLILRLLCLITLTLASSESSAVSQSGSITPGHLATWQSNQTIQDGGAIPSTSPGGTDGAIQINKTNTFFGDTTFLKGDYAESFLGIQNTSPVAPLHVIGAQGQQVTAPATLTASLVLDVAVDSPVTASALKVNGPLATSPPSLSFTYIDQVQDAGGFGASPTSGSGFTANCQTISGTVYAYRGSAPNYIINPNGLPWSLTDSVCDGVSTFDIVLGNWTTNNGYADGFIVQYTDPTVGISYDKDIGNFGNTTITAFTNQDAYAVSTYDASTGATWNGYTLGYNVLNGSQYAADPQNGNNVDAAIPGAYLIINASFSSPSPDDGQYYIDNVGGYHDMGAFVTSYGDYGQGGGTGAPASFSSIAFPYFNTSLSDGSFAANSQNDGSGSCFASGIGYNYAIYEYRYYPGSTLRYFTGGYSFSIGDNNDGQNFYWSNDVNAGDGDGRIWVKTDDGTGGDMGSGTNFVDDCAQGAAPTPSPLISSYAGMTRNWSVYGQVTSPSTKFSSTHKDYSQTDDNPTTGYVYLHTLGTFGNATSTKIIESSAYRADGYIFNSGFNPTSFYEFNGGTGDSIVTPNSVGYLANGSNLNSTYRTYATKTVNGTPIWSPSSPTAATVDPNDGHNYTVSLTSGTVSGATYKFARTKGASTVYQTNSGTALQDTTVTGWGSSSTLTPTSGTVTAAIFQRTVASDTDIPIVQLWNNNSGTVANTGLQFCYGAGGCTNEGQIYIGSGGNTDFSGYNGVFEFQNAARALETRIGPTQLVLNNQHNNYEMIIFGSSNPILYASDHFFGINHNNTAPDVSVLASIRDTNAQSYRMLQLLGSGGSGDYINASGKVNGKSFIVDANARTVIGGSSVNTAAQLAVLGQSSSIAGLLLDAGTLTSTQVANSIQNDGNDLWFTTSGSSRRDILKTGTTSKLTSTTVPVADASGNLIDSTIRDTSGLTVMAQQIEAKNGISLDSGKNIGMGSLGAYTGGFRTSYSTGAVSASLNVTNNSPIFVFTGSTAGRTLTLPTAASISGTVFEISNEASVSVTVASTSSQAMNIGTGTVTSLVLQPGDRVKFIATASTTWDVTNYQQNIRTEVTGGTNQSTYTLGDLLYASAANTLSKLAGNTTSTKKFLNQTGTGSVSAAPVWSALVSGDIPLGVGLSSSGGNVVSNAVYQLSFQPGPLTSVTGTIGVFGKVSKASTVDNIVGSAYLFSCLSNPTVTMYECGTSATCATPTTIGTVTVTAAGTAVNGTVSNPAVTAGDYIGWAITAGTCTSLDISANAQVHSN